MKSQLLLLILPVFWTACQSTDSSTFGVDPQLSTYSDEAPRKQKLFCNSVNCEQPYNQEVYTYDPAGRLIRVDQFGRTASGNVEMNAYTSYQYASNGQLSSKIRYGSHRDIAGWIPYDESEYVYTAGALTQERTYFNQRNPDQRVFTGNIEYEFKDGKKVGQTWFDAQHARRYRVVYAYTNNTLTGETWVGATGNVIRRFAHQFGGNSRQISEYMPNSIEQISLVEKIYDAQGRISSEETKVINPILCSMQAGVIRYVY